MPRPRIHITVTPATCLKCGTAGPLSAGRCDACYEKLMNEENPLTSIHLSIFLFVSGIAVFVLWQVGNFLLNYS